MPKLIVHFENDPDAGVPSKTYRVDIPDFRLGWEQSDEALAIKGEAIRVALMLTFNYMNPGYQCEVIFPWEIESRKRGTFPVKDEPTPPTHPEPPKAPKSVKFLSFLRGGKKK